VTFEGDYGTRLDVSADHTNHGHPCVAFRVEKVDGPIVGFSLDENHAAALAKALEAAVMEIQARAVSR
jgi:hypothetical protein